MIRVEYELSGKQQARVRTASGRRFEAWRRRNFVFHRWPSASEKGQPTRTLPHLNNILFSQWQSKQVGHICSALTQILILYSYAFLPCQHVHILPNSPDPLVPDIVHLQTRIICIELHLPHSPLPFAIGKEEPSLLSKLSSLLRLSLKHRLRQTWRHCYGATPVYLSC